MHSLLSLLLGMTFEPRVSNIIVAIGDAIAILTVPSVLLRRAGRPLAALSWVLALLTLPYLGALSWWMLGRGHLTRQRGKRRRASERLCERCPPVAANPEALPERLRDVLPFSTAGKRWTEGVFPPAALTGVRVLCDGEEAFSAMEAMIARAVFELRAVFYIWQTDATGQRLADLMARKARSGVSVKILVDAVGGRAFLSRFGKKLRAAGVEVAAFLPARFRPWAPTFNFRNHRKLLLIDGELAFTGGMNIGDEYANVWHDLALELEGPVVQQLDDVFREDWLFATKVDLGPSRKPEGETDLKGPTALCTIIASGPDRDENRVHDAFFLGISQAKRRVWLATPYFVPSPALLAALRGAGQRGLDVRVLVPRLNDIQMVRWASRAYYRQLLRAGIRIFEYQPRFSHAKAIVLDDHLTVLGSANADVRTFRLNFELACFVDSKDLNARVSDIFVHDFTQSNEVHLDEFGRTPRYQALVESAASLLSPLL